MLVITGMPLAIIRTLLATFRTLLAIIRTPLAISKELPGTMMFRFEQGKVLLVSRIESYAIKNVLP
jgi:uncharacterized membrane protein YidH (DUF202 family)